MELKNMSVPQTLGTPYDWPEWLGEEPEHEPNETIFATSGTTYYDYRSVNAKLTSIDHSLQVISGGIILAVCVFWFWLTIIRPLKMFTDF